MTSKNSPMLSQNNSTVLSPMLDGDLAPQAIMPAHKFSDALAYLGKKSDRPYKGESGESPKATRVIRTESGVGVRYHQTIVVEYLAEGIRLDSAGYRTVTTKQRFNDALDVLSVRVSVSQNQGVWTVSASKRNPNYTESFIKVENPNYDPTMPYQNYAKDGAESNWSIRFVDNPEHDPDQPYSISLWSMPYFDGVIVGWDGMIVNPPVDNGASEQARIQRANLLIKAYVKETMSRIKRVYAMTEDDYDPDVLPMPSYGDCWVCIGYIGWSRLDDDTLAERDTHLMSHLEECYIVPSLLLEAIREYETRQYKISSMTLQCLMEGNQPDKWGMDMLLRDMPRAIRKYFKSRLAIAGT